MPRENGRFAGLAVSVVEYVIKKERTSFGAGEHNIVGYGIGQVHGEILRPKAVRSRGEPKLRVSKCHTLRQTIAWSLCTLWLTTTGWYSRMRS
jgi:membrane protein YqaA with SNARE-associated domain